MIPAYEPVFAQLFGIKPWEMSLLTWPQFQRLRAHADQIFAKD